mgnify:CR=1 FL=1
MNLSSSNVKSIKVDQAEGYVGQMICATVDSYEKADALLLAIAAMNDSIGYRKTEITITLACGEVIRTRHDVKSLGSENNDLDTQSHAQRLVDYATSQATA